MARISKETLRRINKERNSIHTAIPGGYTVFVGDDGKKYFQLDTYGNPDRITPEKISQSVQFDADTARVLMDIFTTELLN